MSIPYLFDPQLVLRTPRFPLTAAINQIDFDALLQNNAFLEALYLASPVLYDECIKWRNGQISSKKDIDKLKRSVSKYFVRMSSRCTPFGLFSGCAVLNWGKEKTRVVVDEKEISRHTRLDMHYLCALAQQLATLPGIKDSLLYYPNNSIYTIGDELRYVEYTYRHGRRRHQISAVTGTESITRVIRSAANGATMAQMISWVQGDDITTEEATTFIEQLIEAQLLVNELEPAITGKEFLHQIIDVLERLRDTASAVTNILPVLLQVLEVLHELDTTPANDVTRYRGLMTILDQLGVKYEENKLFQTDVVKHLGGSGVDENIQAQLLEAIGVLNRFTAAKPGENLRSFARRFYERYEDKEMPLLEVLDTETGIGYLESATGGITPLIGGIPGGAAKEKEKNIAWGKLETLLHNKLMDAYAQRSNTVALNEDDIAKLTPNWDDLAPSLPVMFRIVGTDNLQLYIESVGGSSAANLLGRFGHADAAIHTMVNRITAKEQALDPEVAYAEIIHLPESRVGNILLHPVFRGYEIPYLAKSSLDKSQQIEVQDLYVSVKNNRVILRSGRLNKQVVPRLSTAHNYAHGALPVYQFLCDLQIQDKRPGVFFNWGNLQIQHRFLPRVTYKNVILHLARWSFAWSEVKHLAALEGAALQEAAAAFRQQWNLPKLLVLADGDNELLIDFEEEAMLSVWLDTVKNRSVFMLREFLNDQQQVTDTNGNAYVNQFVAVLSKTTPSYATNTPVKAPPASTVTQKFSLGSEWLYYKIYCGVKSADKILLDAVKPLSEALEAAGIADKWFFIRYNDPGFHIRLRFHITDTGSTGEAIQRIHDALQPYISEGYIWKLQADTYSRELDRYGANTITQAETFFYHDSKALLELLDNTYGDERESLRWLWGMRAVDELLDVFRFTVADKFALLDHLKNMFATEFGVEKPVKLVLNDKYRYHKKNIDLFMNKQMDPAEEIYPLIEALDVKSKALQPVADEILQLVQAGQLQVPLASLMASYIHMLLNRITTSNPRKHEMVIYDFLSRYYQSAIARQKAKAAI
ncbi:thiopeptide-type bacteriocin biosynthesis domain-containing protein [Chitinophaga jiangningensis]|uniref:Thiopeptide-type bacteriocin biosynthesis domain-containing protein n=1 Tax=Chitinophaga jiangningensis TaxID=1419482 RepID=A0A1M6YFR0_9BACT|nr:lantibiotic dehydratase [Chitinophaga jiangningensis]SHL16943.1 thiopeptide-type bacteriocin biosynthesis domain-containing protein [Chitinophaga jiangningensis]